MSKKRPVIRLLCRVGFFLDFIVKVQIFFEYGFVFVCLAYIVFLPVLLASIALVYTAAATKGHDLAIPAFGTIERQIPRTVGRNQPQIVLAFEERADYCLWIADVLQTHIQFAFGTHHIGMDTFGHAVMSNPSNGSPPNQ